MCFYLKFDIRAFIHLANTQPYMLFHYDGYHNKKVHDSICTLLLKLYMRFFIYYEVYIILVITEGHA